jgi:hypothetical protein
VNYYRATLILIAVVFALSAAGFFAAVRWSQHQAQRYVELAHQAHLAGTEAAAAQRSVLVRQTEVKPLRDFVAAWAEALRPAGPRDLGNHLRNALATLATRTGLTSEETTVAAETRSYPAGDTAIRVQQVSTKVISESLPALLTWLGAVEQTFPAARVEQATMSAYASRSVQLAITLVHPVYEPGRSSSAASRSRSQVAQP